MTEEKKPSRVPVFTILFMLIVTGACVDFFLLRSNRKPTEEPTPSLAGLRTETGTDDSLKPVKGLTEQLRERDWDTLDNPRKDGWTTEALADQATEELKKIGKFLTHPDQLDGELLKPLLADEFRCEALLPAKLTTAFRDDVIEVQRRVDADAVRNSRHVGVSGFEVALRELLTPFRGATDLRYKFKLFRINGEKEHFSTRQYFALSGRTVKGVVEQNATWDIAWQSTAGRPPRLLSIELIDFELSRTINAQNSLFGDCTESVLSQTPSFKSQLQHSYFQASSRYQDVGYFAFLGNPGIAVGDVDGDSLEDLYLCGEYGFPNRLYIQQPDGTVQDRSQEAGVDWLENSRSALLVDLDNDGDQDLAVAMTGGVVIASNDGSGRFVRQRFIPTDDDAMSISAADYNRDGRLDLYVCCYYSTGVGIRSIPSANEEFVTHDANNGGANSLLCNEGDWRFVDVTKEVGFDTNNRRFSLAAAWDDWDNDGDLDCYVANDFGRDNFYRNDGGTFLDISDEVNVEDAATGMGITWGDYDRDGWMDVFVSNMFSAAGNRITFQENFKPDSTYAKRRLQRLARGNTLLRNAQATTKRFEHVSAAAGVEMGRWAWGSQFVDLNNDGWEDLVVANGYVTAEEGSGDL